MKEKILIIEDEKRWCDFLSLLVSQGGWEPVAMTDPEAALSLARGGDFSLVLTDLRMPKMDGIEVLKKIKSSQPRLPVIIITAYSTVDAAIESMKQGAFDYITKPFNNDQVLAVLERAIRQVRLERENKYFLKEIEESRQIEQLVGASAKMQEVYKLIGKVAASNATILIRGGSGTGKELIARTIHRTSPRSQKPFMVVDCSALTETLLESELFGHLRGSFTGANANKKGLIEEAEGGTIFLDEIGNVSPAVQMDLLRFLQNGEIKRVGDTKWRKVEVRMIAATNQDLEKLIERGVFRDDLYYRLNVVTLVAPLLRERREDIPGLVEHFIRKHNRLAGLDIQGISGPAMDMLYGYDWPGNVRELENTIARAMTLARGKVLIPEDLPLGIATQPVAPEIELGCNRIKRRHLENFESDLLKQYLSQAKGNVSLAAGLAKIPRQSFHRLMKKYRIKNPRFSGRGEN
jgi:two-component system, NtrC family, response regulator PilR